MLKYLILCDLLILFLLTVNTADAERMAFPGKEWLQMSSESQGVNSKKLDSAIQYLAKNSGKDSVKELVIVRNGYIIWEGKEIDKVHGVWSLTKSFTSTVLGLLVDDGKVTLDTLARNYIPSMAETYPTVRLRHFTTMTSGYYAVGDEPRSNYKHGPSLTPFKPGKTCLLYTSPSPRDRTRSRMPSSA